MCLFDIYIYGIFYQAYKDLLGFIGAMNDAIKGKKIREECHVSQVYLTFTVASSDYPVTDCL